MVYKAFISYSHSADGNWAPRLQSALQRFAKPWYQLRAVRVFRDKGSLSLNPALWPSIERALDESEYFLLLASREAASSTWVQRELAYWLRHKPASKILMLLTDGDLVWDTAAADFDEAQSTALPSALQGVFADEPLFLDLRWVRTEVDLSSRDPRFREAVADIAATLRALPKDQLIGEEIRQHRRSLRLAWSAVAALALLVLVASTTAYVAVQQRNEAERQRQLALARQLGAQARLIGQQNDNLLQRSVLLAVESMLRFPSPEAAQAIQQGLSVLCRPVFRLTHGGRVTTVAFSPDSARVITASEDGTARLWDTTSGREVFRMEHGETVNAVAFSPNGKRVATASGGTSLAFMLAQPRIRTRTPDNMARVWNLESRREIARMAHEFPVTVIAFSPDGRSLATATGKLGWMPLLGSNPAGDNIDVRLWEAATGREVVKMPHDVPVTMIAFSPDGRYLATAPGAVTEKAAAATPMTRVWRLGENRVVAKVENGVIAFSPDGRYLATANEGTRFWNVQGQEVGRFASKAGALAIAFSPDGTLVAVGTMGGLAYLARAATGEQVRVVTHGGAVVAVAFSPDGRLLATASSEGTARVWDVSTLRELLRATHEESIWSVAFSADGRYLATAGVGDSAWVWDLTPRLQTTILTHDDWILDVAYSPDGKYLATASADRTARVWDPGSGREVARLAHEKSVNTLKWDLNGRYIVTGGGSGIHVWEPTTGRLIARFESDNAADTLAMSPDGKHLAAASKNVVRLLNIADGRTVSTLQYVQRSELDVVGRIDFSPNGQYLAAGGAGGVARIWEIKSGREVGHLEHGAWVNSVAFSPDGRYLATASGVVFRRDNAARVWDTTSWRELIRLEHGSAVVDVAFSPDGRYLASASWDHTAQVWDLTTRQPVASLNHGGTVDAVAFSPDGRSVVSAGRNNEARVWLWRPEDLIAEACAHLSRNLTPEEWRNYIGNDPYRPTCDAVPRTSDPAALLESELFRAVHAGNAAAALSALMRGARPDARERSDDTALMIAAARGDVGIVRVLLDRGADVNAKHSQWGTTALMAATVRGHIGAIEVLLERGADVNSKAKEDVTALLLAVHKGRADTVRLLLARGADTSVKARDGDSALLAATRIGYRDIVGLLKDADARTPNRR